MDNLKGLLKVECPRYETILFVKRDAFIRKSIFTSAIVFCPHCCSFIMKNK